MKQWSYTADLTDEFFAEVAKLDEDARGILEVIYAESGARADILNHAGSGAVGLIQFMPSTLKAWGISPNSVRKISACEQLALVRRYLRPYMPLTRMEQTYCAVFMPADVSKAANLDHVLVERGGYRGWAFAQNAQLDADRNGRIEVRELGGAVIRQCRGPRWNEIVTRAGRPLITGASEMDSRDLSTTYGLQVALLRLGFKTGPLDGIPGPRTTKAVREFQKANGLTVDGIPGPLTRSALVRSLQQLDGGV